MRVQLSLVNDLTIVIKASINPILEDIEVVQDTRIHKQETAH